MSKCNLKRTLVAAALLATSASAFAAEVVLFAGENFRGPRLQVESPVPNLAATGFNDLASSISVRQGTWQVCDAAGFRGGCVTLNEGEYPSLREMGLGNKVSSLRAVTDRRGGPPTGTEQPRISFYERENFAGRGVTATEMISDFNEIGFNDTTRSVVVHAGAWEVCHDKQFRGDCTVLQPGQYPRMQGSLDRELSSARPVALAGTDPGPGPVYGDRHERVRAVLYEGPRFTGRSYVVEENVLRDLDRTRFNDRASSLRVERGYWMFCSDAQFAGECLTFGPGEYPQLPAPLDNRISSGRRISRDYPYREQPHWGG